MAEISGRPITPSQIRAIHAALPRRGLSDDDYRAILRERYDVETCKALTRRQAHDLLLTLGRALPRPPGAKGPRRRQPATRAAKGAVRMVTPAQRALIEELAGEVAWREADGYRRWLGHTMRLGRVSTAAQASRVIEGLKAMRRRQGA